MSDNESQQQQHERVIAALLSVISAKSREKLSSGYLTRSDTNRAVRPQKMAGDLKFRI